MKEGYIGISKYKIFFKSVEGNYLQFSDISWTKVPPCPSTWHKFEIRIQKYQIWDPISALLFLIRFLFSNGISIELAFIYSQIRFCSNYRPQKHLDFVAKRQNFTYINVSSLHDWQKRHLYNSYQNYSNIFSYEN